MATIKAMYETTGEVLCPHSAVAVKVAQDQPKSATPMVALATAHAAKFPDAVAQACGIRPDLPPHMADLFEREERITRAPDDLAALKALVIEKTAR